MPALFGAPTVGACRSPPGTAAAAKVRKLSALVAQERPPVFLQKLQDRDRRDPFRALCGLQAPEAKGIECI